MNARARAHQFLVCIAICGASISFANLREAASSPDTSTVNIPTLCKTILQELERWQATREIISEAIERYPNDPVARGLYLRRLDEQAVSFRFQEPRSLTIQRRSQITRGVTYPRLKVWGRARSYRRTHAMPLPKLNTIMYIDNRDISWNGGHVSIPPELQHRYSPAMLKMPIPNLLLHRSRRGIVRWRHGWTGVYSTAGRALEQVERGSSLDTQGIIAEMVRHPDHGNWFSAAHVADDECFHGAGPYSQECRGLETVIQRHNEIDRSLARHAPVAEASRSAANLILAQQNYLNSLDESRPNPIRTMTWMAPMHPRVGFASTLDAYLTHTVRRGAKVNPLAFEWFAGLSDQLRQAADPWHLAEHPLGKKPTPTLILVGSEDLQVPAEAREYFKSLARRYPDAAYYVEIPGANHDVFAVSETFRGERASRTVEAEERAGKAWSYFYWFQKKHLLGEPAVEPPYGLRYIP